MNPNTQSSQSAEPGVYFKNGASYEDFRPVYPPRLIEKVRKTPKSFKNYLDIATGTGQVLFQMHNSFSGLTVGADISESMLKKAEDKASQLKDSLKEGQEFRFVQGDCQRMDELLQKNGIDNKFDLITIGEAFHWFDTEPLLKTIRENLIESEGVLAILSYVIWDIELITENEELKKRVSQAYKVFYEDTTQYSKFDQKTLYSGYKNVAFDKYFTVEKDTEVDKFPSRIEDIIGHLGTWSMYNTYVEKHSKDADYKDPLQVFKNVLESALKEAQVENTNGTSKPYFMVIPYQLLLAHPKTA